MIDVPPPQKPPFLGGQSAATPTWSARCVQTRAATPRTYPYLLKCFASHSLTHQRFAGSAFRTGNDQPLTFFFLGKLNLKPVELSLPLTPVPPTSGLKDLQADSPF